MKYGKILTKSMELGESDLAAINRYTRRSFSEEELYVFPLTLCDNEIDRDGEAFTIQALEELAKLFVGKTGVFDHQNSTQHQLARIYETHIERDQARTTGCGEPYCALRAKAYLVRCPENEGLIRSIDAGIRKEISVGCLVKKRTCSICGKAQGECEHRPGETYGAKICCIRLDEAADAYEWSFVAVPSQREAGVGKSAGAAIAACLGETDPEKLKKVFSEAEQGVALSPAQQRTILKRWTKLEEQARQGELYRAHLEKEICRLAFLADEQTDAALLERILKGLDLSDCEKLCEEYRRRISHRAPRQLAGTDKRDKKAEINQFFKI